MVSSRVLGRVCSGVRGPCRGLQVGINNITTDNKLVVFLTSLHCTFMLHTQRGCLNSKVKKGKGRFMGLFNTAAVRPILFLPPTSSRIHLQRRHASYR